MKKITIEFDENSITGSRTKDVTNIELLGALRFMEKQAWAKMYGDGGKIKTEEPVTDPNPPVFSSVYPANPADRKIIDADISVRLLNVINNSRDFSDRSLTIHSAIKELTRFTETDFLKQRNCGKVSVKELKTLLACCGMELKKE